MRNRFLAGFFALSIALPGAAFQREMGCVPLLPWPEYTGIPADVDVGEFRAVRATQHRVDVLAELFPVSRIWTTGDGGHHWKHSSFKAEDMKDLVDASGSSRSQVIYLSKENGKEIFRSHDFGGPWMPAFGNFFWPISAV